MLYAALSQSFLSHHAFGKNVKMDFKGLRFEKLLAGLLLYITHSHLNSENVSLINGIFSIIVRIFDHDLKNFIKLVKTIQSDDNDTA